MNGQPVTVVTSNKQKPLLTTMVELAIYASIMYFVVNPEKLETIQDTIHGWHDKIDHRISIWQTRSAIESLPETRER